MGESVPLKAPQRRRRSDSAVFSDPARRRRSALKKSSEAGRSNENKHIGRTNGRSVYIFSFTPIGIGRGGARGSFLARGSRQETEN